MKNNMEIITVGVIAAIVTMFLWWFLHQGSTVQYTAPTSHYVRDVNGNMVDVNDGKWSVGPLIPASDIVAGAGVPVAPNHIVSVDSATFLKMFAYANPRNITVSDTLKLMVNNYNKERLAWRISDITSTLVSVSLVHRTSTTPNTYEVVRELSRFYPNIGYFDWVNDGEFGTADTFIVVGCASDDNPQACTSTVLIPI
jgi:hypothetical protein